MGRNAQCVVCDRPYPSGTCPDCRVSARNAKLVKRSHKAKLTDEEERSRQLNVELYREVIARGGRIFEPMPEKRKKLKPKG